MATQVYRLDPAAKSLAVVARSDMATLGFYEVGDLETWLASCKDKLFSREILWIARQDWPADNQRSDIIGLSNNGDLIVTELKRGVAFPDAITQVLAYAAEYEPKTPEELAELYFEHSIKLRERSLLDKAVSADDAQTRISNHVSVNEINKSQILIILAEGFDDRALAICDYLRRSTGAATFSIELWAYGIHSRPTETGKEYTFLLEQVLPPPSIRAQIEAQREAAKTQKYLRDPKRVDFMRELQTFLGERKQPLTRSPGASYNGNVQVNDHEVEFHVPRGEDHPWLTIPDALQFNEDLESQNLDRGEDEDGWWWLSFTDIDANNLQFDRAFGERLLDILGKLKPANVGVSTAAIKEPSP